MMRLIYVMIESFCVFLYVSSIDSSMYHALGYGTILYTQAVMTFDMVCQE